MHLRNRDLSLLHTHAENCLPLESVALLFGVIEEHLVVVTRIECVRNESDKAATSFYVNPEEEYQLLIEAEARGEELVGIFHSHPAVPIPSSSDLDNMRLNPVVWLIASKASGAWSSKGFVLDDADAVEIPIMIMADVS
jgi:proteasome lid subunit RPN8/RPN11